MLPAFPLWLPLLTSVYSEGLVGALYPAGDVKVNANPVRPPVSKCALIVTSTSLTARVKLIPAELLTVGNDDLKVTGMVSLFDSSDKFFT